MFQNIILLLFLAFTDPLGSLPQQPLVSISLYLELVLFRRLLPLSMHLLQSCFSTVVWVVPLGLLVSGFQSVASPIGPSDLHICPAHPNLLLLRTPIIFVSPYSFSTSRFVLNSYSPRVFLFGPNIFLRTFRSNVANLFSSVFVVAHAPQAYSTTGLIRTLYNVIFCFP